MCGRAVNTRKQSDANCTDVVGQSDPCGRAVNEISRPNRLARIIQYLTTVG